MGKEIIFEMHVDEESRQIEWDNMPRSLQMNINRDFDTVKAYPLMCINTVLAEQFQNVEGLRPKDEYDKAI